MYIVGFGIFVVYMFFLLRMVNKQHKIQEQELNSNLKKTSRGSKLKIKKSKQIKIK